MPWCRCGILLVLCICPLTCFTVSFCPPGCCCPRQGFFVLCESLGLRSLPGSVPLSTSALSVAKNQLCNVDHLLRPLSGLQELSLSHNLLARFPRGLPPSLESLLLQENRITYITSGGLRHLGNLTRLDLEDNQIRAIQPGALQGLNKLKVLTLKGNKLTSLPQNLPPSLTHLDLSANCISALDLPSLSSLVNLQVLKINSNCLRSVPESAFDSLPRLRSVDLTNNLWVCECDILYLYRWLLSGRIKMATDLVCTEPVHLAHRLLLNLSVMTICPRLLKPNQRTHHVAQEQIMETLPVEASTPGFRSVLDEMLILGSLENDMSRKATTVGLYKSAPKTRILPEQYSLEMLSYDECLSLNKTQSVSQSSLKTTSIPDEEQKCRDNVTGRYPQTNSTSTEGTGPLLSTNRVGPWPTADPRPSIQQDTAVVIALLAVLCVLVALLMAAVLLVLKKTLLRQQRVAPLDAGSGR
ncbi:leucine-rich alpha-2-glycoprotein [Sphaeramia orbicularis]|uniref:Leucine-rich alpha-2-glycoprotein-like n=1 Tax=Sphaeramia orbicularis TaxID=375764 RepID=A0A673CJQ0_9TELE|nr:leucine-rich alpha-2-glycoprotein-like [Sphaeramia orbicularis]